MMRYLPWILQILILAAGIHLFLRFVRTTRGNRLIRGLFLSVLVGVVGLWGLARALDLEVLEHLLRSSTGFIVVGFAIVFQSELRRGIAQLGEHSFLGDLAHSTSEDTLQQIVQAAKNLAARRIGALIVIERDTPLTPYVETGTNFDSQVQASLLESLFHPGAALHDGAVIVRVDRIAAAGCILPLTQDADLSPSLGTRHRAALGMAEESDAVVLVVSEEKGTISIAHDGKLKSALSADQLDKELGELLDSKEESKKRGGLKFLTAALHGLRRDIAWLPGSLLLAVGIFYVAYKGIEKTSEYQVVLVDGQEAGRRTPREGEILVLLAQESDRLVYPQPGSEFDVRVTGTRGQLDQLQGSVRGLVELDESFTVGSLEVGQVRWVDPVGGMDFRWGTQSPRVEVQRYGTREHTLTASDFAIDAEELNPRYHADDKALRFEPGPTIDVFGPEDELDDVTLQFEPIVVTADAREEMRARVRLKPNLRNRGFSLPGDVPVEVVVPIVPVAQDAGTVTMEIALVCMDPKRRGEEALWDLPANAQTARFAIVTSGLIPANADPSSAAMIELFGAIQRFVENNLNVYIDVAELSPDGDRRSARIRWTWRTDWRESLDSLKLEGAEFGGREELDVRLESDREILLELRDGAGLDSARAGGENL